MRECKCSVCTVAENDDDNECMGTEDEEPRVILKRDAREESNNDERVGELHVFR
jgi:hypothetical protein